MKPKKFKVGDEVELILRPAWFRKGPFIGKVIRIDFDWQYDYVIQIPEDHPYCIYCPGSFLHGMECTSYRLSVWEHEIRRRS